MNSRNRPIEPGILRAFEIFSIVQLCLMLAVIVPFLVASHRTFTIGFISKYSITLVSTGLLIYYLAMLRRMSNPQKWNLLLGIIWATFFPLLQLYLLLPDVLIDPSRGSASPFFLDELFLFIPMVIIAWEYPRKFLLFYCGFTLLLEAGLSLFTLTVLKSVTISPLIQISFLRIVISLLIGLLISNLVDVQKGQNQKIIDANEQLKEYASTLEQLTISRERNRMARELHDILAHTLSGVAVELEGVRTVIRTNQDVADELVSRSLQAVREGLTETRLALQDLRSSPLQDLGLSMSIQNLAESVSHRTGINIEIRIAQPNRDYPIEVQQCFYRVAQEAISNIVDHASARKVLIQLQETGKNLILIIRDDGVGFDQSTTDTSMKFGVIGMKERAEMINAKLTLTSELGSGTQIMMVYDESNRQK